MAVLLPVVTNPTPLIPGTFNRYWISSMFVYKNALWSVLLPYDGTNILVGSGAKSLNISDVSANPSLSPIVRQMEVAAQNIAGKSVLPTSFSVSAPSPLLAVKVSISFPSATPGTTTNYALDDLLGLVQTNSEIATACTGIVGWITANIALAKDR